MSTSVVPDPVVILFPLVNVPTHRLVTGRSIHNSEHFPVFRNVWRLYKRCEQDTETLPTYALRTRLVLVW